jgi:hypothetical protein
MILMEMPAAILVSLILVIFLLFMLSLAATSAWVAYRDRKDSQTQAGSAQPDPGARRGATDKAA